MLCVYNKLWACCEVLSCKQHTIVADFIEKAMYFYTVDYIFVQGKFCFGLIFLDGGSNIEVESSNGTMALCGARSKDHCQSAMSQSNV